MLRRLLLIRVIVWRILFLIRVSALRILSWIRVSVLRILLWIRVSVLSLSLIRLARLLVGNQLMNNEGFPCYVGVSCCA